MRAGRIIVKGILGAVVLGTIAISMFFAFQFGFAKGATEPFKWAYGLTLGGLDLLKAALPLMGAIAWAAGQRGKGVACGTAFIVFTVINLWAAWGITAGQLNERMGLKAQIVSERQLKQQRVDRLRKQIADLPKVPITSQAVVDAAKAEVETAEAQAREECGAGRGGRGRRCRAREEDVRIARGSLRTAEQNFAATHESKKLNDSLRVAEADLANVDVGTVAKHVDPQAANIAEITGISEDLAATISHWLFAIGIEVGSGLGLWLVFGHGHVRREPELAANKPANVDVDKSLEAETDHREAFFDACIYPSKGGRVKSGDVYMAYTQWCRRTGQVALTAQAFGRGAPRDKRRIGGKIFYMDVALAPSRPELRVVASS